MAMPKGGRTTVEHHKTGSREWRTWFAMRRRCLDPSYSDYHAWGGRGITVCDRWADFTLFLVDMGPCPPGHTLDRKENDGNYEPSNCRWATRAQQRRNARNIRMVTAWGRSQCATDWATELGLNGTGLRVALDRGVTLEEYVAYRHARRQGLVPRAHAGIARRRRAALAQGSGAPEDLLDTAAAAAYVGIKKQTLHNMRSAGSGPTVIRQRDRVLYRRCDLDVWLRIEVETFALGAEGKA